MKKAYYFLSILTAAAMLTACSSNDDVVNNNTTDYTEESNTYLNVRISLPGTSTSGTAGAKSRNTSGTPAYEAGTGAEYKVTKAHFLFYDTEGKYLTYGRVLEEGKVSQSPTSNPTSGNNTIASSNIESNIAATVVLGPTTIKGPVKMVTLLNYQGDFDKLLGKSFVDMLGEVESIVPSGEGSFEMSTSAFLGQETATTQSSPSASGSSNSTVMQYTYVPQEKFVDTAQKATTLGNYVTAYVERTVAKVGMSAVDGTTATTTGDKVSSYIYPIVVSGDDSNSSNDTKTVSVFYVDEENKSLAVNILGWTVNGYNKDGYLLKHISAGPYYYITDPASTSTTSPTCTLWPQEPSSTQSTSAASMTEAWNAAVNYRSFWAEDKNYKTSSTNASGSAMTRADVSSTTATYNGTSSESDGSRSGLVYYSLNDFLNGSDASGKNPAKEKRNGEFGSQYVYENTVDQIQAWYQGGEQYPNVTCMLVVGQIGTYSNTSTPTWTAFNSTDTEHSVFRINGAFYSADYIKQIIGARYSTTANSTTTIDKSNVELVLNNSTTDTQTTDNNTTNSKITITCNALSSAPTDSKTAVQDLIGNIDGFSITAVPETLYVVNSSTVATAADVQKYLYEKLHILTTTSNTQSGVKNLVRSRADNTADGSKALTLASDQKLECFKDGYCYYQVPIQQPAPTGDNNYIFGVVRNHNYKLILNSVSNIGDPIFDEDKPLEPIPGKDTYYYLGAEINVLQWRDVTQDVTL